MNMTCPVEQTDLDSETVSEEQIPNLTWRGIFGLVLGMILMSGVVGFVAFRFKDKVK